MAKRTRRLKELRKAAEKMDTTRKELALRMLSQLEFMDANLSELQRQVKEDGPIIETTNGNGFTVKTEHPASKAYTALVGKFNAMSKAVGELVLDDKPVTEDDFTRHITRRTDAG